MTISSINGKALTSLSAINGRTLSTLSSINGQTVAPSSITPPDVTGLVAWWKADALVLSNNDAIHTWADSSGNGHTLTDGGVGNEPIYNTNQQNSLPGATFDGNRLMTITTPFSSSPVAIFAVLKGTGGDRTIIGGDTNSAQYRLNSSDAPQLLKAGVTVVGTASTTLSSTTFYVLDMNYDGTTLNFFLNGAADGTASNAQTLSANIANVGSKVDRNERFIGVLCELFVYNNVPTGANQDGLQAYLGTKWGITVS